MTLGSTIDTIRAGLVTGGAQRTGRLGFGSDPLFVLIEASAKIEYVAAATRALAARAERLDPALTTTTFTREDRAGKVFLDSTRAGGATVVAAYSPRIRPGVPVSFPGDPRGQTTRPHPPRLTTSADVRVHSSVLAVHAHKLVT